MRGSSLDQLHAIRLPSLRRLKTDNLRAFVAQLAQLQAAAADELLWRERHAEAAKVAAEAGGNVVAFKPRGPRAPAGTTEPPAA